MKSYRKIMLIIIVLIWAAYPVFSQSLADLKKNVDEFTDKISQSLPFNSTIGLNWSDAYIGNITDVPRHFGVGISTGLTNMDINSIGNLLDCFNLGLPLFDLNKKYSDLGLLLPCYTVEARIGGVKIPFDVGLKAGFLHQNVIKDLFDIFDYGLQQMLFGADVRYCIVSQKVIALRFSVGLGFNYLQGSLINTIPSAQSYAFTYNGSNHRLNAEPNSKASIEWRTINVEFKPQISFPFKFITPYAGAGVSYAWSRAGYRVKTSKLTQSGNINDLENILKEEYKLTRISSTGFETLNKFNNIGARAFGGASINIAHFRIDITGMYELFDGYYGATVGLRFQL